MKSWTLNPNLENYRSLLNMTIFLKSKKTTLAKVTGLEYDKRIKFEREREREDSPCVNKDLRNLFWPLGIFSMKT